MKKTVLLVVDVQEALVRENPYNKEKTLSNIEKLIKICREKNIEGNYSRGS